MRIARHKTDREYCEELLDEHREYSPARQERARLNPSNLNSAATVHLSLAKYASVVCPDSDEIPQYVGLASYALAALFRAARANGKPTVCNLGYGEPVTYTAPVDESLVEANNWITAFFLAIIRRDNEMLDELCLITADQLRKSSTRHPEYRYLFAEGLRSFWLEAPGTSKVLTAAMEATDPHHHEFQNVKWVLQIDVPLMHVFFAALAEDANLEEIAIKAIQDHKAYWSSTSNRRDDRIGFWSIGLTAMMALARDRGLAVNAESDYTPARLVTGDFPDA